MKLELNWEKKTGLGSDIQMGMTSSVVLDTDGLVYFCQPNHGEGQAIVSIDIKEGSNGRTDHRAVSSLNRKDVRRIRDFLTKLLDQ